MRIIWNGRNSTCSTGCIVINLYEEGIYFVWDIDSNGLRFIIPCYVILFISQ